MIKPSNYFSGNRKPMEVSGNITIYGFEPIGGHYKMSAFNEAFPMTMYGHDLENASNKSFALRWGTKLLASDAVTVLGNFGDTPSSGAIRYIIDAEIMPTADKLIDAHDGEVTADTQHEWANNDAYETNELLVVNQQMSNLGWICEGNEDDFGGALFRAEVKSGFEISLLKDIVSESIQPDYKEQAPYYVDRFHDIFNRYAQLVQNETTV